MECLAKLSLKLSVSFLLLVCLTARPQAVSAQQVNANLSGAVKDESGAMIPGVTVTATNTQTGLVKSALTNEEGRYSILSMPPGTYNVQAELPGFATSVQRNREFLVGTTVTLDITMKVASTAETVEVTTDTAKIDTTQSQVATVITPSTMDNLPTIGRSFGDLAALSPGTYVNKTDIQIGGNQAYQTGYIVDGTNTENGKNGGQTIRFAQDWITEFSLVSQGANAEFGQASGGFVNAVSRSGTNSIHGRVYGYFQDSRMNSYSWGAKTKPHSNQQRIGGMIGGPARKDKVFYFFAYEAFSSNSDVVVTGIPSQFINAPVLLQQGLAPSIQNGTYLMKTDSPIAMGRLDFALNPKHTFWLRANNQGSHVTGSGFGNGAVPEIAGTRQSTPSYVLAGAWTWNINPESLNELRINYARQMVNSHANCLDVLGSYTGPNAAPDGAGAPNGYWAQLMYPSANGVSIRCNSLSHGNVGNSDFPLADTYSLTRGHHQLKVGGDMHYYALLTPAQHRNRADPQVTMAGNTPFTYNLATQSISALPLSELLKFQHLEGNTIQGYSWGMFASDNFQVTPNVTLNLGIRYDIDRGGLGLNKLVLPDRTHFKGIYDEVSPRFGFAWSPFADKATVFRGAFGVFYDKTTTNLYGAYRSDATAIVSYDLAANRPSGNPYCFGNTLCSSGTVPTLLQQYVQFELAKSLVNFTLPHFPQPGDPNDVITIGSTTLSIPPPTFVGPTGGVLPAPTGASKDLVPDFRNGGTLQYSFGAATQFGPQITASADYVYNRGFGQYLIMDTNVNPITKAPPIDPRFTSVLTWTNRGFFTQKSIRTRVTYRAKHGDVQAAYTWARAYDNTINGFTPGTGTGGTNPLDPMTDYGPSGSDAQHSLTASGTYLAPFGIRASPIFQFISALPYTATTTAFGLAGCESYFTSCYPVGYSKNSLRGQSTILLNARLSKQVRLGEKRSVTVMGEAFNLPNRANFATNYGKNVSAANFKLPTGAGPMRQLQLGFQIDF